MKKDLQIHYNNLGFIILMAFRSERLYMDLPRESMSSGRGMRQ